MMRKRAMSYVVAVLSAMFVAGWTGTVIGGDQDQDRDRLQLRDGSCLEEELLMGSCWEDTLAEMYSTTSQSQKDPDKIHKGPDVTTTYQGPACGNCPKVP
jgi:hypothetical protein